MKVKNRIQELGLFLEDLTYSARYTFLEEGKDDNELQEVGKKSGLHLPSKDLAIFKCIYAFVDTENKNGCTLPREEVESRLHTLVGKAIDLDHFRKRTVGYWIHTELDGDKVMAYGAFWKNNFSEEFDEIKRMLLEGALKISFEAWGDRVYKGSGRSFDLTNIEFAGGALLLTTQPAFAGAKVLEMAKDMSAPREFIYERGKMEDVIDLEESQFHFQDYEIIARLLYETECPSCKTKGAFMVETLDFSKSASKVSCGKCGCGYNINFVPSTDLTKKGKTIKDMSAIKEESNVMKEELKVEVITEKKEEPVVAEKKEEEVKVEKAQDPKSICKICKNVLGIPADGEDLCAICKTGTNSVPNKAEEVKVEEKPDEIALLKTQIDTLTKSLDESKKALEENTAKLESLGKELETTKTDLAKANDSLKAKEDAEKASKVKTRRDALGDYGKELKDEEILDDLRYENATLKKALAEKNPELANKLEIGSKDKSSDTEKTVWDTQKKVQEKFTKQKKG